jgi:L-amino acid N-acyltransferase
MKLNPLVVKLEVLSKRGMDMSTFTIRTSHLNDLPAITEIYNDAVLNSVATFDTEPKQLSERHDWFNLHQNPKYPMVSAVSSDDQVIGWGTLSPFHPRPAYDPTVEFSVYVHKEYRGMGVGNAILEDLINRGTILGFHSIIGLITGSNIASLGMAEKFGFERVGLYKEVGKKFGSWQDVAVVQLFL